MAYRFKLLILFFTVTVTVFTACASDRSSVRVERLRCEYQESPQGLDEAVPRFSWNLTAVDPGKFGQAQSAYRIVVSGSKSKADEGNMWDSGWVESDEAQLIAYAGKPLVSDRTYYWKVQVRDEAGQESRWSETGQWTTGIFDQNEWTAAWVGSDEVYDPSQPDCNVNDPWLRKTVDIDKKPARAMMFVASIGFHELYVNGRKLGDDILVPIVSDHNTRARYVVYDMAPYLKKGRNVIALWLGTSWAIFDSYAVAGRPRTPMAVAQADIYYDNPEKGGVKPDVRIVTDATWKTYPSPNKLLGRWNMNVMGGEIWDANREVEGWNELAFDDSGWADATTFDVNVKLTGQNTDGNRKFDEIKPVAIEEREDGSYRVDMGVNFAGWTRIRVKADPGTRVDFLFSERQQEVMTFRNYSAFIVGPSGEGTFRNRFNYSSGRWITIRGAKEKPSLEDITGWMVRTNYSEAAQFECSDELQNWIYDRVLWTYQNLSIGGYIVDCPQRERLGYGGDAHATVETGMFNFRMGSFYSKWMQDWRDVQGWDSNNGPFLGGGSLPHTAPTHNGGGGPSWGGIVVSLPWFLYQHEGDTRILEKNYELITNWLEFLDSHTENGILKRWGGPWDYLADWLWPNATAEGMNNNKPEAECFNSSFYAFNLATAARIARVLGKADDAAKWGGRADVVRAAVHAKYFDAEDNSYCDRSMGNLALALIGEVPPAELRGKVMERLEKEILVVRNGHIHVGITGGALLFKLLREMGRDDLIFSMTSQTDYPGWGFMKANDATTIWEMWEKDLPGHSLLHSSYLYPGAWYIDGVAGIRRNADHPGFKQFIVRSPKLKESDISWAKATFKSPVGIIKSDWKKEGGLITHEVSVPANSSALVYIPEVSGARVVEESGFSKSVGSEDGYLIYEVPAGNYTFRQVK